MTQKHPAEINGCAFLLAWGYFPHGGGRQRRRAEIPAGDVLDLFEYTHVQPVDWPAGLSDPTPLCLSLPIALANASP